MTAEYGVTRFEFDEENDVKSYGVLFTDVTHGTPPFRPLYLMTSWLDGYQGFQKAYERLSVPSSKGWDIRCKDGYPLACLILTTDEESKDRAVVFREMIRPYIVDGENLWNKSKSELAGAGKSDSGSTVQGRWHPGPHEEFSGLSGLAQYDERAGGDRRFGGARGPRREPRPARQRSLAARLMV